MKTPDRKITDITAFLKKLVSNPYALGAVLLIAALLLISPLGRSAAPEAESAPAPADAPGFSLEAEEQKIALALSEIDGVGEVSVLLSLHGTVETELAESGGETLVVSSGSGTERTVSRRYLFPEYKGALVVCDGADSQKVRLSVTEAVASLTGLGSDKVTVSKMKNS